MQTATRENLRKIFKKVKKLHLPKELESVPFSDVYYYSWPDESSQSLFLIYDYEGNQVGIKLSYLRTDSGPLRLGFCEFCLKHRGQNEVIFVAAETKKRPKHVNYQVRGTWICSDYAQCNKDLKNDTKVKDFVYSLLYKE
jgi:hypothetical protein